ncbi:MAG: phosphoribosylanthranilate isomerase [Cocleimonas sp.]|jgi:phosphoribosylanthranilate isomerase
MTSLNQKIIRTRVKICGITSIEAANDVCSAGADSIGLVFYEKSPRNVTIDQAKLICDSLPPFVTCVGLFLNPSEDFVNTVLKDVKLDLLQFHGIESAYFCNSFPRPYIKAIGMEGISSEDEFAEMTKQYTNAKGFLVDSHATGKAGGTGKTFDWKNVPQTQEKPIILAGGLNPENVADALQQLNLYGVDLSSGVESQPGIKDPEKVKKLMNEVYRVQCSKR